MKRMLVPASVVLLMLSGCSGGDLTTEPSQAEKAWHNCTTVLSASELETTEEGITPTSICANQRDSWEDFDTRWVVEIERLVEFYEVDRGDVSVYAS